VRLSVFESRRALFIYVAAGASFASLAARGLRLGLASSSGPEVIEATLTTLGIRALFEAVVSGVEVARGKPAPDVFLETAKRLGVAPGRCVVVEDSERGVRAARAAGMRCVAVPCGETRHHDFRDATLASAFVARWCAGSMVVTDGGVFRIRDDEPAPRIGAGLHRTP